MVHRYTRCIIVAFISLLLATSCDKEGGGSNPPETANLTLIFYMGGDSNGLSGETFQKIRDIANINMDALRNDAANIFIYQDHSNGDARPTLWRVKYSDKAIKDDLTTLFYKLTTLEMIETYDEQNSASGETLKAVIARCKQLGEAQHYGLWAFSHGSGWLPAGTLQNPRAPSNDYITPTTIIQDGNQYMELADFTRAIPDNFFDFIIFESCLTGGIEVSYELRHKTKYAVVSPTRMLVPGYLGLYKDALPPLFRPWKNSDPLESLKVLSDVFFNHWNTQLEPGHRSATVSVIKTEKMSELAAAVADIALHGGVMPAEELATIQQFDRNYPYLYYDFGHYFSSLASTGAQRERLNAAIDAVVMYKNATEWYFYGYTGAFEIIHSSGLTTYVPQARYPFLDGEYKKLGWAKAIAWE